MKVRGFLVEWLIEIDPSKNSPFVVHERDVKTFYLLVEKVIHVMLKVGLMCYWKFRSNLDKIGFHFSKYDACVANRTTCGLQYTIHFHVDDIVLSHLKEVNDTFAKWVEKTYG